MMTFDVNNSAINDLKKLTDKLYDRDVKLKNSYNRIIDILNNSKLTDTQKIKRIKKTVNN